jgi:hypothetical protein
MAGLGDYIGGGWNLVKSKPAEMIGGGIAAGITTVLSLGFLGSIVATGYYGMIAKARRGEAISFGDIYSRFDADAFMIGLPGLACGLAANICNLGLKSPGLGSIFSLLNLAVGAAFLWAMAIQGAKKTPWMDALKGSLDFWMKDIVGNLIVVVVAGVILNIVGMIACGVGLFVTIPITYSAFMICYLDKSGILPYSAAPSAVAPAPAK